MKMRPFENIGNDKNIKKQLNMNKIYKWGSNNVKKLEKQTVRRLNSWKSGSAETQIVTMFE